MVQTRRRRQRCRVLLIDETSIRKRHRYVTVVVNGDTGEVLAMVQGRSKQALSRFFVEQGPRWCHGVQTVVTDGSRSYRAAIGRYLPHTRHVLDRFHAVRWFTQGLTLVRRELQRRQPPGVKPAFEPDLFRARFALLKRHDHLSGAEQKRLDRLFDTHPRLQVAWDALQQLYGLYEADDLQGALRALERFADLYETGQIPEYHTIVDTILNWSEEILAWHHNRHSNGPLEGINNLIQTLRRTAHGFTNYDNYAARGLLLT
ncbi:MAG: ISL3 family transposase [bacterium]|nr:ISL3 family transposase [bacterium]